ncbi:MAG: ZIP family metal transporter [Candidatus Asgardarchaeia archaeon]
MSQKVYFVLVGRIAIHSGWKGNGKREETGMFEWLIGSIESLSGGNLYIAALLVGSICMILTFIGALPAILGKRITDKFIDVGLGFSAGIMIVASFTSLILPGIELGGIMPVVYGFVVGAFVIFGVDKIAPHKHFVKGYEGPEKLRERLKVVWLLVIAVIIHNFPEGLAVGASVAYGLKDGVMMAIAIGIQDIPEGLAVALPLVSIGKDTKKALWIAFLSGAVEPIMALIPVALTSLSMMMLPFLFGFAAGAMIYVVSHEVIPETHRHGYEDYATLGLIIGFVIMLFLDVMLG